MEGSRINELKDEAAQANRGWGKGFVSNDKQLHELEQETDDGQKTEAGVYRKRIFRHYRWAGRIEGATSYHNHS